MQKLKDDEWLRLFEEFKKFEGTAKDFCKANGVNDKTFYSRRRKMLGSNEDNKVHIVPIVPEANDNDLNFVIVNGNKIEFNNTLAHDQLSAIIKGLTQ